MSLHVSRAYVELIEAVIQDIGDHVLANQVVELHRRMKWIYDVDNACEPSTFEVRARMADSDDGVEGYVDAAPWLSARSDENIRELLEDNMGEGAEGLYHYFTGARIEDNRSHWGIKLARDIEDYIANSESGYNVSIDEEALEEWVKKNRPDAWLAHELDTRQV